MEDDVFPCKGCGEVKSTIHPPPEHLCDELSPAVLHYSLTDLALAMSRFWRKERPLSLVCFHDPRCTISLAPPPAVLVYCLLSGGGCGFFSLFFSFFLVYHFPCSRCSASYHCRL